MTSETRSTPSDPQMEVEILFELAARLHAMADRATAQALEAVRLASLKRRAARRRS